MNIRLLKGFIYGTVKVPAHTGAVLIGETSIQVPARDRDKGGFVVETNGETASVRRGPVDTYVSTLCGLRVGVSNER
jgi:hypothetical protein